MPANMIRLGPFLGGLNTFSDPTAVADTEVVELVNLELDTDGSLRNRPPVTSVVSNMPGTVGVDVLGWFQGDGGVKYLIATNRVDKTFYFNGTAWVEIASFAAAAMAQARDKAWLVAASGSSATGGSWSPTAGFVADANMPKGGCAVAHKDRVWIGAGKNATTNGARLYLSSIESGTVTWPATPIFIQIGSGDGENIVDLAVYFDALVIFKEGSTFSFNFSTDPSLGEVRKQSQNIGALDKGCVTAFQNSLYVVFDNKVYEFANYNFTELAKKVPLRSKNPSSGVLEQSSISYWSDRLFVQFYDVTYVYSLKTGTWSTWQSDLLNFMGRVWLIPGEQDESPTAYTYSTFTGNMGLYQIVDEIGAASEQMTCRVTTKNYDYQNPANFKALKTWGIDCISKVEVNAFAIPVVYANANVTWELLLNGSEAYDGPGGTTYEMEVVGSIPGVIPPDEFYITKPNGVIQHWYPVTNTTGYTWEYLNDNEATWDRLLDPIVQVESQVETQGAGPGRKFIKFPQALRFRQIGFRIEAETSGDVTTAPFHLFSIMTKVADKQYVSKRIS